MAHKWARWMHNPCRPGVRNALHHGTKSEMAHKWVGWPHTTPFGRRVPQCFTRGEEVSYDEKCTGWLQNARHLGGPQRFIAGDKIRRGPPVWWVAT